MKKNLLAIIFGLIIIFTAVGLNVNPKILKAQINNKPTVAACPSWHDELPDISSEDYKTVRTNSTKESLDLLKNGEVDFIIAGRPLKSNEPELESEKLGEGYIFLAKQKGSINISNIDDFDFQTDLPKKEVMDNFSEIKNLEKVDKLYDNLSDKILITSFDNVDYSQAELVDIVDGLGRRIKASRRPTLYFAEENKKEAKKIKKLIKN